MTMVAEQASPPGVAPAHHYSLTVEQVRALAARGNMIPLYREVVADLETPVSAYLKVTRGPYGFLLESIEGGERLARYSFIGTEPRAVLRYENGWLTREQDGVRGEPQPCADPLTALREEFAGLVPVHLSDLPPLVGGAVGYLGYEVVSCFEPRVPRGAVSDLAIPQAMLLLTDTVLAFDHYRHSIKVITHVRLDQVERGLETFNDAYSSAVQRIEQLVARLHQPLPASALAAPRQSAVHHAPIQTMVGDGGYQSMVSRIKEYIVAGDVIQVVPSQRFMRQTSASALTLYRALRVGNPSPHMYYLHMDEFDIAGASVELLVRVTDRHILYHPIAGTRRRGLTPDEDAALADELQHDPKERAEHIMLVDLGRNDVGRVAQTGSVRVTELMGVRRYSRVMHLESTIEGLLADGKTAIDALRSCFPAGTLSGAPKVRAMEIIAELEPHARDTYGGCVGYFSYSGDLDTCITIRTAVLKDGVAYVQAGGGIVADSDADLEHQETIHKASAVWRALDLAESGLL